MMKRTREAADAPGRTRSSAGSAASKRRLSFLNGANSVKYIAPPPKSQNPNLWFTETQRQVQRPLIFTLEPGSDGKNDVTITIDLLVNILSAHISLSDDELNHHSNGANAPAQLRCVLEILPAKSERRQAYRAIYNIAADSEDEDGDELFSKTALATVTATKLASGGWKRGPSGPLRVRLPAGQYTLRNNGPVPITISALALDITSKLV